MQLYTIGYQGLLVEQMLSLLLQNHVQVLVDVREHPISRKRGFSKSVLATTCKAAGMAYVHLPALGSPRAVRHAYRADGDWRRFSRCFETYLATQNEVMGELAALAIASVCCLLCYEADPCTCHRSLLVARLAEVTPLPLAVRHLRQGDREPVVWRQAEMTWAGTPGQ